MKKESLKKRVDFILDSMKAKGIYITRSQATAFIKSTTASKKKKNTLRERAAAYLGVPTKKITTNREALEILNIERPNQ